MKSDNENKARRRISLKDIIFFGVIIAALTLIIVKGVRIQSVDNYYRNYLDVLHEDSDYVYLSIECTAVLNNRDSLLPELNNEKYIPADGVILPKTKFVLHKGETVFDIIKRAGRIHEIIVTHKGTSVTAYVNGINHLTEFACGPLSGWLFGVDGASSSAGAGLIKLAGGEYIEWKFTCDLGTDIGWNVNG